MYETILIIFLSLIAMHNTKYVYFNLQISYLPGVVIHGMHNYN